MTLHTAVGSALEYGGGILVVLGLLMMLPQPWGWLAARRERNRRKRDTEAALATADDEAFFARIKTVGDRREERLAATAAPVQEPLPPVQEVTAAPSFKLRTEPLLDPILGAYPRDLPGCLSSAHELGVTFALLRVRNESTRVLRDLLARCVLTREGELTTEWNPLWSMEDERGFGGPMLRVLGAGQERLLVIAKAFRASKLWARLPPAPSDLFYPFIPYEPLRGLIPDHPRNGERLIGRDGKPLDLPKKAALRVEFWAEDFRQVDALHLGFDADGPVVRSAALDAR